VDVLEVLVDAIGRTPPKTNVSLKAIRGGETEGLPVGIYLTYKSE
jgi:hypothetical protein